MTLYEFFLKKFLKDSQIGATHVISSIEEVKERKIRHFPTITQEFHANREVASCCVVISFTDDDLLLGSKLHNRPLFVVVSIRE